MVDVRVLLICGEQTFEDLDCFLILLFRDQDNCEVLFAVVALRKQIEQAAQKQGLPSQTASSASASSLCLKRFGMSFDQLNVEKKLVSGSMAASMLPLKHSKRNRAKDKPGFDVKSAHGK